MTKEILEFLNISIILNVAILINNTFKDNEGVEVGWKALKESLKKDKDFNSEFQDFFPTFPQRPFSALVNLCIVES